MECAPVPQARLAERADPCPTGINEFQTAISSASQAGMGAKTCFISPELIGALVTEQRNFETAYAGDRSEYTPAPEAPTERFAL